MAAETWPASRQAEGELQFISLRDTAVASDANFCALLAALEAAQAEQPGGGSGSSIAGRYGAYMAQLPQLPACQSMLPERAAAESWRLAALLLPKLAAAGATMRRRQRHGR